MEKGGIDDMVKRDNSKDYATKQDVEEINSLMAAHFVSDAEAKAAAAQHNALVARVLHDKGYSANAHIICIDCGKIRSLQTAKAPCGGCADLKREAAPVVTDAT